MKIYFLICVLLSSICVSCSNDVSISAICEIDSVILDIDECEVITCSDDSVVYSLVPLDDSPECAINSLAKMTVTEKGIFVLSYGDKDMLLRFNHDGSFANSIGVLGHSKREYVRIMGFTANEVGDTITIIDNYGRAVKTYDNNGKYINTFNLSEDEECDDILLLDGCYYTFNIHHTTENILTSYDKSFENKTSYGKFQSNQIVGLGINPNYIQHSNGHICVLDYFNSCFYLFNRKTNDIMKYVISSSRMKSPNDIEEKSGLQVIDGISGYLYVNDKIYCTLDISGESQEYVIDTKNNKISAVAYSQPLFGSLDYYEGTFYKYISPMTIDFIKTYNVSNPFADYVRSVFSHNKVKVFESENGYLLLMKVIDK